MRDYVPVRHSGGRRARLPTTMGSSEGRRRGLTVVPTECRKIVSARPPMNFPFYLTKYCVERSDKWLLAARFRINFPE